MTVQAQYSVIPNLDLWLTQVLEAAQCVSVTVTQLERMPIKYTDRLFTLHQIPFLLQHSSLRHACQDSATWQPHKDILRHKNTHSLHTFRSCTLNIQFKTQHEVPRQYQFLFLPLKCLPTTNSTLSVNQRQKRSTPTFQLVLPISIVHFILYFLQNYDSK